MKNLTYKLFITLSILGLVGAFATPAIADAQSKKDICDGLQSASSSGCGADAATPINNAIGAVIDLLSLLVGIAAVVMIIIGGFKYVTSTGDSAQVSSAKNTILYAIVGLVIVALAQVIVRFVINKV